MARCWALLRVNIPLCSRLGKKPMVKPTGLMTRHKIFLFTSPSMAPPLPEPQSNHNGSVFMAHNSHQTMISIFLEPLLEKLKPTTAWTTLLSPLSHPIASPGQTQNGLRSCARFSNEPARREGESGCRPVWTPQTRVPPALGLWSLSQKERGLETALFPSFISQ